MLNRKIILFCSLVIAGVIVHLAFYGHRSSGGLAFILKSKVALNSSEEMIGFRAVSSNRVKLVAERSAEIFLEQYAIANSNLTRVSRAALATNFVANIKGMDWRQSSISPDGRYFVVYGSDSDRKSPRFSVYNLESNMLERQTTITTSIFRHYWQSDSKAVWEFYKVRTGVIRAVRRDVLTGAEQVESLIQIPPEEAVPVGLVSDSEALIILPRVGNNGGKITMIKARLLPNALNVEMDVPIGKKEEFAGVHGGNGETFLVSLGRTLAIPGIAGSVLNRTAQLVPRFRCSIAVINMNSGVLQRTSLEVDAEWTEGSISATFNGGYVYILTGQELMFGQFASTEH
ncbi:MAG: hypothetical protein ABSG04_07215 [Verrucomicrobiota bacterium]